MHTVTFGVLGRPRKFDDALTARPPRLVRFFAPKKVLWCSLNFSFAMRLAKPFLAAQWPLAFQPIFSNSLQSEEFFFQSSQLRTLNESSQIAPKWFSQHQIDRLFPTRLFNTGFCSLSLPLQWQVLACLLEHTVNLNARIGAFPETDNYR